MKFKITTPERIMLDADVDSVTLPTEMGQITVLQNHIPLVASLVPGEVKYKQDGKDNFFVLSGGFVEVKKGSQVIVLADSAEFGHEIDIERAEAARERARKLMQESKGDERSFADAAAAMERSLMRLKVARKHRSHTNVNLEAGSLPE